MEAPVGLLCRAWYEVAYSDRGIRSAAATQLPSPTIWYPPSLRFLAYLIPFHSNMVDLYHDPESPIFKVTLLSLFHVISQISDIHNEQTYLDERVPCK